MRERQAQTEFDVVQHFAGLRVLVIGDAMLDRFVEGTATRICKEAPVPVVQKQAEQSCPGGAANTAANLSALGADVRFVGILGDDPTGHSLRAALREAGVDDGWLVADPNVTTLHKLRVLADDQYIVRLDEGDLSTSSPATRRTLLERVRQVFPSCDLVVLSDYGYGTISDEIIEQLRELRDGLSCPLVVDSREIHRFAHAGATLITPNLQEAREAAFPARTETNATPADVALQLRGMFDAEHIAITMAANGVLLIDADGRVTEVPAYPVRHPDEAGAGDTFAAAASLALASGASATLAAQVGIDAATIACTTSRIAVVTHRELLRRVILNQQTTHSATRSLQEIATQLDEERRAGRRIVFTNGVFDILHAGHVQLLCRARALGDILVVGINSDASVRRLKGDQRPINREQDRLALIAALDAVDYALIFTKDTPAETIRHLRPDVHVKGGDYTAESLPEIDAVREVGAQVEILPLLDGLSTTNVINRIISLNGSVHVEQTQ